MPLPLVIPAVG